MKKLPYILVVLVVLTLTWVIPAAAAPWEAPHPTDLLKLVQGRDWPILMALVIGAIVRQLKADARFPITVPKRLIPFMPLVLSAISAVAEIAAEGVPWRNALAGGFVTMMISMTGHDFLRGLLGRDVPLPSFMLAPPAKNAATPDEDVPATSIPTDGEDNPDPDGSTPATSGDNKKEGD